MLRCVNTVTLTEKDGTWRWDTEDCGGCGGDPHEALDAFLAVRAYREKVGS